MQTTKWASFKHRWVRAEVYPLAAAIGGALGICSYFVYNKAFNDPSVTWSKGPRKSGVEAQYSHIEDDVKPLWSSAAANRSISVFRSTNEIMDAKRTPNPTFPPSAIVVADPDSDDDEDDENVEEVEAAPVVRIINEDGLRRRGVCAADGKRPAWPCHVTPRPVTSRHVPSRPPRSRSRPTTHRGTGGEEGGVGGINNHHHHHR